MAKKNATNDDLFINMYKTKTNSKMIAIVRNLSNIKFLINKWEIISHIYCAQNQKLPFNFLILTMTFKNIEGYLCHRQDTVGVILHESTRHQHGELTLTSGYELDPKPPIEEHCTMMVYMEK